MTGRAPGTLAGSLVLDLILSPALTLERDRHRPPPRPVASAGHHTPAASSGQRKTFLKGPSPDGWPWQDRAVGEAPIGAPSGGRVAIVPPPHGGRCIMVAIQWPGGPE